MAFLSGNVHNQSIHMSFTFLSFADVLNNCSDDSRKGRQSIWIAMGWSCGRGVAIRQYWMRAEMSYAAEVMTKYQNLLRYLWRMPKRLLPSTAPSWKQENKQLLGWHNEWWKEGEKNLHNASPLWKNEISAGFHYKADRCFCHESLERVRNVSWVAFCGRLELALRSPPCGLSESPVNWLGTGGGEPGHASTMVGLSTTLLVSSLSPLLFPLQSSVL